MSIIIDMGELLATISYDGNVAQQLPMIVQSSCKFDVRLFPFDVQMCSIDWLVMSYFPNEVQFRFGYHVFVDNANETSGMCILHLCISCITTNNSSNSYPH